jgi:pimeloyl-ACP methyl ester carboxylesterase
VHPGGPIPYELLADDAAALIDALGLQRPFVSGYGDGGHVATILGMRHPEAVRAIVNHGGYDLFNADPQTPSLVMTRQMLGGRPDATEADPDAVAGHEHLRVMVDLMKADHDHAQGDGHWKAVLRQTFDRVSHPAGYSFDDFHSIAVPTLILVGDRDPFCSIEDGINAYRALSRGELAVLPNVATGVNRSAIDVTIEFLERH